MRKAKFQAAIAVVLFAFLFLFAGVERGQAQTGLADNFFSVPAANYVSSANAEILLNDQVTLLHNFLLTLTPGSQQYKATLRAAIFYRNILIAVKEGKQVPQSIVSGMAIFTTTAYGQYTRTEQKGLKLDAIDLLSN
ncbi:MAG: hypothetical protein H6563_12705 [Lewinellaceae bacterium]|nr:hypothetical protein [Lewinellaceae bacterium]